MRSLLFLALFIHIPLVLAANAKDYLNQFHNKVITLQAEFSQVLTDANNNTVQESKGTVWIKRPGQFRWEYRNPYPQKIISDGSRIWIYDPELEQVTVKDAKQAIGNAPGLVLSGERPLEKDFIITEDLRQDEYAWVSLVPMLQDTDFTRISVAFAGDKIAVLELRDNLGQNTRIHFKQLKINQDVDDKQFQFKPPPGTDVIGAVE